MISTRSPVTNSPVLVQMAIFSPWASDSSGWTGSRTGIQDAFFRSPAFRTRISYCPSRSRTAAGLKGSPSIPRSSSQTRFLGAAVLSGLPRALRYCLNSPRSSTSSPLRRSRMRYGSRSIVISRLSMRALWTSAFQLIPTTRSYLETRRPPTTTQWMNLPSLLPISIFGFSAD